MPECKRHPPSLLCQMKEGLESLVERAPFPFQFYINSSRTVTPQKNHRDNTTAKTALPSIFFI